MGVVVEEREKVNRIPDIYNEEPNVVFFGNRIWTVLRLGP